MCLSRLVLLNISPTVAMLSVIVPHTASLIVFTPSAYKVTPKESILLPQGKRTK